MLTMPERTSISRRRPTTVRETPTPFPRRLIGTTNYFHFVAVDLFQHHVSLYLDGQLATNDPGGLKRLAGNDVLATGFYILAATATVSCRRTVCSTRWRLTIIRWLPNDVQTIFNWIYTYYEICPWNTAMFNLVSAPSSAPQWRSTGRNRRAGLSATGWFGVRGITSSNVWITNVTASVTGSGTNNMMLQFTIQGGSNGMPYDVFANSVLDFSSNTNTALVLDGTRVSWQHLPTHEFTKHGVFPDFGHAA